MPAALLALAGALTGCATPVFQPSTPRGVAVPAAWHGSDAGAEPPSRIGPLVTLHPDSLAEWWLRFNDPQLAGLVQQALRANPGIDAARAALRQARALRDGAAALLAPTLGGSGSAQTSSVGGNQGDSSYRLALDAGWAVDLSGAQQLAVAGTEAGERASAASLGQVQVSVAAEVALAYIALRSAQARIALALANLDSQLEILQIALWRERAGLTSKLATEQGLGATDQLRALRPVLLATAARAAHALAVLTGQPPADLARELEASLGSEAMAPLPRPDLALSLPADTLRQRGDVRMAEWQVQAAMAGLAQAQAQLAPSFRLGGSLGLSALTPGALLRSGAVVTSLLAGVTIPWLDGGAGQAQVRVRDAGLGQAQASWRATVLTALQEVEDALVTLRSDRERLDWLQAAAQAALRAAAIARQQYQTGLVDYQSVLETQRFQLNAQDSLALARADFSADHVRLYKALGGGWQPDQETP